MNITGKQQITNRLIINKLHQEKMTGQSFEEYNPAIAVNVLHVNK